MFIFKMKTDFRCCFKIQSLIGKSVTLYKVLYFSKYHSVFTEISLFLVSLKPLNL